MYNVTVPRGEAEAFLRALLAATEAGHLTVNVYLGGKEDALADAKLALDMSYADGTAACRALAER